MQGGRGGHGSSDPFAGFGGLGSFGGHGSPLSSVFGGRDPFDDPFFTRPFGGLFGGSPFGGMLEPSFFGQGHMPFPIGPPFGFIEQQQLPPEPQPRQRRGPVIEEIDSDDENVCGQIEMPRKHGRIEKESGGEDANYEADERKNRHRQFRNEYNGMSDRPSQLHHMNQLAQQPGSHCMTFHSSSVTYGGTGDSYYTKSTTMRTGSDGLTFQEHKEADSTTGQATHQISRGLHNKGHTLSRKLKSDGRVDSMQTLHNLDQDELAGFEETWKRKAKKQLPVPDYSERFGGYATPDMLSGPEGSGRTRRGGLALPSTEEHQLENPRPQKGKRVWSEVASHIPASHQYSGSRNPGDRNWG